MAEASSMGVDPKTGLPYQNKLENAQNKTAPTSQTETARMQDAASLKPKATGRGMLSGESVAEWKARLKKMDDDNDVQQKALTK